jgi:hypothetical protein
VLSTTPDPEGGYGTMNRYILVIGNPVDGYQFEGPYDTAEDAIEAAEYHWKNVEWVVAELRPVKC